MSTDAYTPEQWTAVLTGTVTRINSPTRQVAIVDDTDMPQGAANARLIAAAPDLLEALQEFEDWAKSDYFPELKGESGIRSGRAFGKLRAAIAKAGGAA